MINYKTALENVTLPLYYQGVKRKERETLALEYLDNVGLKEWATHLPSELSGGQKQRIGLARILYKNPSLIILDEATSSLDILTEEKIIKTINSLVPSKTIIAVSHRLSTLENCKKIFSLENRKLKIIK